MRALYEREKRLRESAKYVIRYGEPVPSPVPPKTYVESATAAELCKLFERPQPEDHHSVWLDSRQL